MFVHGVGRCRRRSKTGPPKARVTGGNLGQPAVQLLAPVVAFGATPSFRLPLGRWPLPAVCATAARCVSRSGMAAAGAASSEPMIGDHGAHAGSLAALGSSDADAATRWRPWRSYAVLHLWALAVPSLFTRPLHAPLPRSA